MSLTDKLIKYIDYTKEYGKPSDEELYKKYNLTDEEINIIESVIKARR